MPLQPSKDLEFFLVLFFRKCSRSITFESARCYNLQSDFFESYFLENKVKHRSNPLYNAINLQRDLEEFFLGLIFRKNKVSIRSDPHNATTTFNAIGGFKVLLHEK
jgi:hypothetical protein